MAEAKGKNFKLKDSHVQICLISRFWNGTKMVDGEKFCDQKTLYKISVITFETDLGVAKMGELHILA